MLRCTEQLDVPPVRAARRRGSPDAQRLAARRALPCTPCAVPAWASAVRDERAAWQLTHAVYTHALSALHELLPTGALSADVMRPADGALWRAELTPMHTVCANANDQSVLNTNARAQRRRFVRLRAVIEQPADVPSDAWANIRVAPRVTHALAPVRAGDVAALESVVLQANQCHAIQLDAGRRGVPCFLSLRGEPARLELSIYIEATYAAHALFERLAHAALRYAALSGATPTLDWRDAGVVEPTRADGPLAHAALAHWYATVAAAHPLAPADSDARLAARAARVVAAIETTEWAAALRQQPPEPEPEPEPEPAAKRVRTIEPPPPLPVTPPPRAPEPPTTPERVAEASPPPSRHPAFVDYDWSWGFSLDLSAAPNASQYAAV